jgi:hypothetical protein
MIAHNTLNVCLGHLPFPQSCAHHIDLMVSPKLIQGASRLALVEDKIYGPNGSAFSEYAQLFWIYRHIDSLMQDLEYIRIFQYRRFVSAEPPVNGKPSSNLNWATVIMPDELVAYNKDFDRQVLHEIFSTPIQPSGGMLSQYAFAHVLEDMMNFCVFLMEAKILSPMEAAAFLREEILIPSCNMGVFRKKTFTDIYNYLSLAAEFLYSRYFIARDGYQRRNVGFLLERLNCFLILQRIRTGLSEENFGYQMIISSSEVVSITD